MGVLTETEEIAIENQFQDLLHICTFIRSDEDRNLIRKAFDLSHVAHGNMRRKSGEPYIVHPLCVACIVVKEIGLGTTAVVAALLHDVVEDNPDYTVDFIRNQFGPKVASIVDGLTKISDVYETNTSMQAENFRKMLLTISDDIRVILIKLADRLHNMRTLDSLSPEKQIKISSETIFMYAPLAHRLGFYSIKQELEDLSLKYRHPRIYGDIINYLKNNEEKRNQEVEQFMKPIKKILDENGYSYDMTGRPKSLYSIYHKMQHKGVPLKDIFDLTAIRIIFDSDPDIPEKKQCWNIYSLITDVYTPKHDRIRDWVSTPKANGYEALHITVMGIDGKWAEVQIRTRRMDEIAEKGFAAHWKYKGVASSESELDKWLQKIKETLQTSPTDAIEFIDDFKMNLFANEIQVFTPKGQIKTLPQKSIALDFAYEIHSEIGNEAIAAKINHKLAPLTHELRSGDQVEIITSEKKQTHRDLLDVVVTAKAKASIKNNIRAENRNRVETGKNIFEEKVKEYKIVPNARTLRKLFVAYDAKTKEELYSKIGSNLITLDELPKILKRSTTNKFIRYWQLQLFGPKRSVSNKEGDDGGSTESYRENADKELRDYRIANCCNPIPGDDVTGCLDPTNDIVLIHKTLCPNAVKLTVSRSDLIVPVKWTYYKVLSFLAEISLQGIDRPGIFLQIASKITEEQNVNMRTINLTSHDGIFEGTIELYIRDKGDLENLMESLKTINGMETVKRLEVVDQLKQ